MKIRDKINSTILRGRRFERSAANYLVQQGLTRVVENYRSKAGEIDLIMRDGETLVFVEVRYRSNANFGGALPSIDRRKQSRITKTAQKYLQETRYSAACRFDVIGITDEGNTIEWVKDAFHASS